MDWRQHKGVLALLSLALALASLAAAHAQEGQPPLPTVYSGSVTVGSGAAADGLTVVAVLQEYESNGVPVKGGRYAGLTVSPPSASYQEKTIRFFLVDGPERVTAVEADIFQTEGTPQLKTLDLTFPRLPGEPVTREGFDRSNLAWALGGLIVVTIAVRAVLWIVKKWRPEGW